MNIYRALIGQNCVAVAYPEPVVPWDATEQAGIVTCWFAADPEGVESWEVCLTPLGVVRGPGIDLSGVRAPGEGAIPVRILYRGPMPMLVSACPR